MSSETSVDFTPLTHRVVLFAGAVGSAVLYGLSVVHELHPVRSDLFTAPHLALMGQPFMEELRSGGLFVAAFFLSLFYGGIPGMLVGLLGLREGMRRYLREGAPILRHTLRYGFLYGMLAGAISVLLSSVLAFGSMVFQLREGLSGAFGFAEIFSFFLLIQMALIHSGGYALGGAVGSLSGMALAGYVRHRIVVATLVDSIDERP